MKFKWYKFNKWKSQNIKLIENKKYDENIKIKIIKWKWINE